MKFCNSENVLAFIVIINDNPLVTFCSLRNSQASLFLVKYLFFCVVMYGFSR